MQLEVGRVLLRPGDDHGISLVCLLIHQPGQVRDFWLDFLRCVYCSQPFSQRLLVASCRRSDLGQIGTVSP